MIVDIQRFVMAVHCGSLTKAAKLLEITQPALSFSIKRLENGVGTRVFKNVGNRLVLSKDGQAVYEMGMKMLKMWDRARDGRSRELARGTPLYSIGVFDNAALKLSNFFQKNITSNRYQFEITIDKSGKLLDGLRNGIFDIAICLLPFANSFHNNLMLVKKIDEPLLPVSGKKWTRPKEAPFILYDKASSTRNYIDEIFLKNAVTPQILVESTSPSFIKELAIGSCGIALLPENFIVRELESKQLFVQKLPYKFVRTIGVFLSKDGSIKESDSLVSEIIDSLNP